MKAVFLKFVLKPGDDETTRKNYETHFPIGSVIDVEPTKNGKAYQHNGIWLFYPEELKIIESNTN